MNAGRWDRSSAPVSIHARMIVCSAAAGGMAVSLVPASA